MKRIGYEALQLEIEKELYNKIDKKIKSIGDKLPDINTVTFLFNELYTQAIDITEHYSVKYIIERIRNVINIDEYIRLFLFQSEKFEINCFPKETNNGTELIIFVNQMFFNNLNEDEQVGIIGHEISHFIFGHHKYSLSQLLTKPMNLADIGNFKANIVYWAKVREITADAIGLVANGFNNRAYSTVIIKHFTGLTDSSQSKFNISPLVEIVLQQYDLLSDDIFFNNVSSIHPSMPLRVKVVNEILKTKLVKFFGEEVSDSKFMEYKREYNELINNLIKKIYPELYKDDIDPEIVIPLALAVILADGKIDEREIRAFEQIEKMFIKKLNEDNLFTKYKNKIFDGKTINQYTEKMNDFVNDSLLVAKKKKMTKHSVAPIVRILLLVAASDETIDLSELDCIYQFAKNFGFTRDDIVNLIVTQYKL